MSVDLSVAQPVRSSDRPFTGESISSFESGSVSVDKIIKSPSILANETLYRKNLKPVSYVMSELSGSEEAPSLWHPKAFT